MYSVGEMDVYKCICMYTYMYVCIQYICRCVYSSDSLMFFLGVSKHPWCDFSFPLSLLPPHSPSHLNLSLH